MKLLVINNLSSGYRDGMAYDFVRAFAQDGDDITLRSTDGSTDIASLLADATSFDAVVAAGGDGTVTAVAWAIRNTGVPLLILPAGTGNLMALNLGQTAETHALAKMLREMRTLDFDLASITPSDGVQHGFGIMAGAGFDALIMRDAQPNKKLLGPLAYFQAGARNMRPQSSKLTLELDGKTVTSKGLCVLIANFSKIQFDISVAAENKPRDGLLDVAILKSEDALGLMPAVSASFMSKTKELIERGDVIEAYQARHIRVVADPPMAVEFDGEVCDAQTPFEADALPGSMRLIVSEETQKLFE